MDGFDTPDSYRERQYHQEADFLQIIIKMWLQSKNQW